MLGKLQNFCTFAALYSFLFGIVLSLLLGQHSVIASAVPNISKNDSETTSENILNITQADIDDFPWRSLFEIDNKRFQKLILPSYIDWKSEVFANPLISDNCRHSLKNAFDDVFNQKTWAVKMFDSWAKFPPSGAWLGTLTDFGGYDQCLSVEKPVQYCLVDSKVPMPQIPQWHNLYQQSNVIHPSMNFDLSQDNVYSTLANVSSIFYYVYVQTGVCLPQECSSELDIRTISQLYASKLGLNVTKYTCESNKKGPILDSWGVAQYCAIALLSIIISLNIVSFVVPRSSVRILKFFHPVDNVKKIFFSESKEDLNCIHGLRFFTMLWIIAGHTLEWNNLNVFQNTFAIREQLSDLSSQPFFKAHYSVDTFFYLSGLLAAYVVFKVTNYDLDRFKVAPYFFLRYLRLAPQLGAFLLLSSLLPFMFDGPLWDRYMGFFVERCKTNWWINMLFMQNVVDLQNICMVHTWYLAVDMQLHWFALIPIFVILLSRRKGLMFVKSIILACTLFSAAWIFWNQLPPGSVITSRNNFLDERGRPSTYLYFFYKPWSHAPVFFIGFIFGCFIDRFNSKKYLLTPRKRYFLWFTTFAIYLFCCLNTAPWLYGRPYDPAWSAVLYPLNMIMWSVHLTLIIWLCISKNGGIVDRILSSKIILPYSRMTYCVYLVHPWAFAAIVGTRRALISRSLLFITSLWLAVIVLSYFIALIFTVLFEVPIFHFLEYLKDELYSPPSEQSSVDESNDGKDCKELQTLCNVQK